MQRLTIYLNKADKYNTLAFIFKNEKEKNNLLSKYSDNIKKSYVSNLN